MVSKLVCLKSLEQLMLATINVLKAAMVSWLATVTEAATGSQEAARAKLVHSCAPNLLND